MENSSAFSTTLLLVILLILLSQTQQTYGQNEKYIGLVSPLMEFFQSRSLVIHSNEMDIKKWKNFKGYINSKIFHCISQQIRQI